VHTFESPIAGGEFSEPEPGNVFAAIDVEACAGPNQPEGTWDVNEFDFILAFPDNTRRDPAFAGIEPAFTFSSLRAGDCIRGFISFEVPEEQGPTSVLYEGFDSDFDDVIIEWLIP
jgi:Domain of unknown function (DUF4352)